MSFRPHTWDFIFVALFCIGPGFLPRSFFLFKMLGKCIKYEKDMYICTMTVPKLNLILWTSLRHRGDAELIASGAGVSYMTVHRAFHGSANPALIEYMNDFYEERKNNLKCYIPQSLQQALSEL